jgi:glycosyltransferase involved in cell wall biosynthesis
VGGVEFVIAHQAAAALAAGHQPSILAGRGATWHDAIPVVLLPLVDSTSPAVLAMNKELAQGAVPAAFGSLVAQVEEELAATLRRLESDVLIAHNVASLAKNLPLTAALHRLTQQSGAPGLLLWHHDLAWGNARDHRDLHGGAPWDLLRCDWPWAQQVAISAARREELAGLGIPFERIHVVPNGVDQEGLLKLEAQTQALAEQLGLRHGDPLLLLPARITRRKNIQFALQVLAHLRRLRPNAQLVVTGPKGPHNPTNQSYFDDLIALRADLQLEGAAHFLAEVVEGAVPDAVVADLYRLSSALFMPSLEEGFGIPLLEAAMTRLPIFCSDIPPLRELGGEDAFYFALDADPAAVAQQVARTLESLAPARFMQRASHYSWRRLWDERIEPIVQSAHASAPR